MSISGLGQSSFTNPLAGLMNGLGTKPAAAEADDPAAKAAAAADAKKAADRALLDQIREKGIYAYAQEVKLQKLREMAEKRVYKEEGIKEEDVAGMSKEQLDGLEARIQEVMKELIREAQEKAAKEKTAANADGQTPTGPMIIDISV